MSEYALDYVEHTGPVTRVGVYRVDRTDLVPSDATEEAVTEAAEHLSGYTRPMDVLIDGYGATLTYERRD